MRKLIRLALVASALIAGASATMANNRYDLYYEDWSKAGKGYDCNSQQGARAWMEQQQDY